MRDRYLYVNANIVSKVGPTAIYEL